MARLGVARAGISFLIAVGVAILSTLGLTAASSGASQSASIAVIAIDTDVEGNSLRTVGSVEDCISATAGQPVDIDIVLPSPGIPADRGMVAYQFSILYDPAVVWIGTDDSDMLLAQATGSAVIPIADPKPDNNGVYQSWGVDFGTSGIEPAGSSETGPGVIARITLLPQSNGVSPLILSGVLVIDDARQRISLESVQSATIHVGEPCSEQSRPSTPTPTSPPAPALTPTPTPAATATPISTPISTPTPASSVLSAGAGTTSPASNTLTLAQGTPAVAAFSSTGGPPSPGGSSPLWLIGAGLAALGSASLIIGSTLPLPHRSRQRGARR